MLHWKESIIVSLILSNYLLLKGITMKDLVKRSNNYSGKEGDLNLMPMYCLHRWNSIVIVMMKRKKNRKEHGDSE